MYYYTQLYPLFQIISKHTEYTQLYLDILYYTWFCSDTRNYTYNTQLYTVILTDTQLYPIIQNYTQLYLVTQNYIQLHL